MEIWWCSNTFIYVGALELPLGPTKMAVIRGGRICETS